MSTPQQPDLERHIGNYIRAYREQLIPSLSEDRQGELEKFFEDLLQTCRAAGAKVEALRSSRDLTEEGRQRRIADERAKALSALHQFVQQQEGLEKELAAARHAALQGMTPMRPFGYTGREPTPPARADRVADLLARLPEQQRVDAYIAACQSASSAADWELVDAVESVPAWARQVPDRIVEMGQSMRLTASPCAPAVRALEQIIAARTALTENAIRHLQEF